MKKLLLIGDTGKVKELGGLLQSAASVTIVPNAKMGLISAKADPPDAIVFIIPVYWENLLPFVEAVRQSPALKFKPIIYVGDFIEGVDQTMLKQHGVHTITLGPVPTPEIVRYILSLV